MVSSNTVLTSTDDIPTLSNSMQVYWSTTVFYESCETQK